MRTCLKKKNMRNKKNGKKNKKQETIKKIKRLIIIAIIAIIAISAIIVTSSKILRNRRPMKNNKNTCKHELSSTAQFFEEEIDGVKIKFFAIKDENGEIKTAFDACDVCFNSKKGYTQDGEYMVCNNCGNRYHVSGLGTENKARGGCWPSYLNQLSMRKT
jgi:uncharacterized membrane protein